MQPALDFASFGFERQTLSNQPRSSADRGSASVDEIAVACVHGVVLVPGLHRVVTKGATETRVLVTP
jgi:hypothetical protein